jgi:hypothetical protein
VFYCKIFSDWSDSKKASNAAMKCQLEKES